MACLGSVVFPHVRTKPGPAARRGSVIHKFIEDASTIGRVEALAKITDEPTRNLCGAIDLNLFPAYFTSEVTFEFDASTSRGRVVHINSPRDYPYNLHCFYGTADMVGVSEDGQTVIIVDVKTGKRLAQHASENWQLRSLACAAADAYGCVKAKVGLAYIDQYGQVEFEWAEFSSLDLADYSEELSWLDTQALKASEAVSSGYSIDVTVGDHCEWCPAMLTCPAHLDTLKSLDPDLALTRGQFEALPPAALGNLYDRLSTSKAILESASDSIKAMAKAGPLDLGDGKQLKYIQSGKTVVNSKRLEDFTEWLIKRDQKKFLRPSMDDMDAATINEAKELGFILDIRVSSLRKVRT